MEKQTLFFCALLVKEAVTTKGDAISEVREAVDFLRYYASEATRTRSPVAMPGPTGETNELRLIARGPGDVSVRRIFRWPWAILCWPGLPRRPRAWRWKPSN
ncbi:hypothetical protein [Rhodoferax sp. PAMC 29310]|uniref:hypothetical protein n=1 Tax=Rhodoferax sp. PAMC 29310 TaxID=2822760 RepID=UPI0021023C18|nr:hypothetical protein [Rhodoferax sp. PAMC 29310]